VNETVYDDVAWPSGRIMYITFHDNVFSYLDVCFTAWAAGGEVRKEPLSVFSNGSMAGGHAGKVGT